MFKQLCLAYATPKKKYVSKQNLSSLLISTINQADLLLKLMYFPQNQRSSTLPKCIVY